jgi:hypothetical protein
MSSGITPLTMSMFFTISAIATSYESNLLLQNQAAWRCSSCDVGKSVKDHKEQYVGLRGINVINIGSHQMFKLDNDC